MRAPAQREVERDPTEQRKNAIEIHERERFLPFATQPIENQSVETRGEETSESKEVGHRAPGGRGGSFRPGQRAQERMLRPGDREPNA